MQKTFEKRIKTMAEVNRGKIKHEADVNRVLESMIPEIFGGNRKTLSFVIFMMNYGIELKDYGGIPITGAIVPQIYLGYSWSHPELIEISYGYNGVNTMQDNELVITTDFLKDFLTQSLLNFIHLRKDICNILFVSNDNDILRFLVNTECYESLFKVLEQDNEEAAKFVAIMNLAHVNFEVGPMYEPTRQEYFENVDVLTFTETCKSNPNLFFSNLNFNIDGKNFPFEGMEKELVDNARGNNLGGGIILQVTYLYDYVRQFLLDEYNKEKRGRDKKSKKVKKVKK